MAVTHRKHRHVLHEDFTDLSTISQELAGVDACFWALGVSSVGVPPQEYERITVGFTAAVSAALAEVNPDMTFVFVSGAGTDSSCSMSLATRTRWAWSLSPAAVSADLPTLGAWVPECAHIRQSVEECRCRLVCDSAGRALIVRRHGVWCRRARAGSIEIQRRFGGPIVGVLRHDGTCPLARREERAP